MTHVKTSESQTYNSEGMREALTRPTTLVAGRAKSTHKSAPAAIIPARPAAATRSQLNSVETLLVSPALPTFTDEPQLPTLAVLAPEPALSPKGLALRLSMQPNDQFLLLTKVSGFILTAKASASP